MKFSSSACLGMMVLAMASSNNAFVQAQKSVQTGPNTGSLYAAGMSYDPVYNELYLTGITYDPDLWSDTTSSGTPSESSNCMVAIITVPEMEVDDVKVYGSNNVIEACRSITILDEDTAIVVGNSDPNGLYYEGSDVQAGFGMAIDRDTLEAYAGASLFSDSEVPYPQSVVAHGADVLYVASMTSDVAAENDVGGSGDYPNWTYKFKHGKSFEMTVEKLTLQESVGFEGISEGDKFVSSWTRPFPVDLDGNNKRPTVYVGGMILKNDDFLVVAGSTRALGEGYGDAEGNDEDGFITLLDADTGELKAGRKNNERYGTAKDDAVSAICDDPNDSNSIYVVGATKGDMDTFPDNQLEIKEGSLQAFISKINLTTLRADWTRQIAAKNMQVNTETSAYALGCSVNADGSVYVGGVVEDGAGIVHGLLTKDTNGGDDVFVAQLDADGSINWIQQIGSSGKEELARLGGVTSDKEGNAILFGNTNGDLFRDREISIHGDIFVMSLNKADGQYEGGATPAPVVAPTGAPVTTPVATPTAPPVDAVPQDGSPGVGGPTGNWPVVADDITAIQTGPDVGPSYAGGMTYNSETNSVFLTGATYGAFSGPGIRAKETSSCFFGIVDLPRLEWQQRETYGTAEAPEACSGIAMNTFAGNSGAIVVGTSETGGLLTEFGTRHGATQYNSATQYGVVLDIAKDQKYELVGGAVTGDSQVNFPISVVTDEDNGFVYVASMTSKDTSIKADFEKVEKDAFPNFTTGGIAKWGSKYNIEIEKFSMDRSANPNDMPMTQTLFSEWNKPFETADQQAVYVSGMITIENGKTLMVVGTTRANSGDDMDGLMTKVSPADGKFVHEGNGARSVAYYSSVNGSDDWILNVCSNPDDDTSFFIVGASQGFDSHKTTRAMIAKIQATTLTSVWSITLPVTHANGGTDTGAAAVALGCDVIPGEGLVYVAGTVENGATLDDAVSNQKSAGKDDIFVVQIYTMNGDIKWAKQIGSNGDDRLSRGGGVKVDGNGNAVVFGDTTGDFYRFRNKDADPQQSDLFLVLFDKKDGSHQAPLVGPPQTEGKSSSTGKLPSEWYSNIVAAASKTSGQIFGIVVLVVVLLAIFVCAIRYCRRRQTGKEHRNKLFIPDNQEDLRFGLDTEAGNSLFQGEESAGSYSDNPMVGNHHKTFSDLEPEQNKRII